MDSSSRISARTGARRNQERLSRQNRGRGRRQHDPNRDGPIKPEAKKVNVAAKPDKAGRAQIRVRPQLDVRDGIAMVSRIAN
jgi:hypothetical protein